MFPSSMFPHLLIMLLLHVPNQEELVKQSQASTNTRQPSSHNDSRLASQRERCVVYAKDIRKR